jgi:hypothetical protein
MLDPIDGVTAMQQQSAISQVKSGFILTGKIFLMMGWLGLVFAGIAEALSPASDFNQGPPHRALGWVLLAIASLVLTLTMDRWTKVFPGLAAYAAVNSTMAIASGHALNNPQVRIPRLDAVIIAVVLYACAFISFAFTKHRLTIPDRMALFAFVFCVFWQAVAPHMFLPAMIIAGFSLALAWAYDLLHRTRNANRRAAPASVTGRG